MTTRQVWGFLAIGVAALAAAATAAQAAPAKERRLHLAGAEASSYLVNDWNRFQENYLPLYVGDDDPKTAWSLKTEGIGEWVRVLVTPMEGATRVRLRVRNGYQKTDRLFAANSRARGVTVVLLPSKKTVELDLADQSGWQELAVEQAAGRLEGVELRIRSVYPGKKYDDLCLSDLQVFVTAASPDNPAFEKLRFDKITAWKKERIAAAQLFQTELGKALPVAAQYVATPGQADDDVQEWPKCANHDPNCYVAAALDRAAARETQIKNSKHAAAVRQAVELVRGKFAGMTAARLSPRDKRRLPQVDGLCTPSLDFCEEDPCHQALPMPLTGQLAYLNADALAVVEQTGLPSFDDVMKETLPQCNHREPASFAWVLRDAAAPGGAPGRIRALLLASCGTVESREGPTTSSRQQLLVYGADGALEVIAGPGYASTLDWAREADGPKLAGASLSGVVTSDDLTVQRATAVAGK